MSDMNEQNLRAVLEKYAAPDPALVSKLAKSWKDKDGRWHEMMLDYVGHAEVTRILIEVDPLWSWEPLEIKDGRPVIHVDNGVATMWGRLTLHGKTMLGVGSARADKSELDKELIGDFLRNAAMRFGVGLNLWSKQEQGGRKGGSSDGGGASYEDVKRSFNATDAGPPKRQASAGNPISPKQQGLLVKLAGERGLDLPAYATETLGRQVESVGELNSKEASDLIGGLMGDAKPPVKRAAPPKSSGIVPSDEELFGDEEPF